MYLVIIDNDRAYLRSLEILLAPTGFKLQCFTDPTMALAWLSEHGKQVSGLIVDYFMPDMNGLELLHAARTMISPNTVVVLVSGHAERLPLQKDHEWPVHAVLPKPLDLAVLTRLLPHHTATPGATGHPVGSPLEPNRLKHEIPAQGASGIGFQHKN